LAVSATSRRIPKWAQPPTGFNNYSRETINGFLTSVTTTNDAPDAAAAAATPLLRCLKDTLSVGTKDQR
jgi:hypothetical protein